MREAFEQGMHRLVKVSFTISLKMKVVENCSPEVQVQIFGQPQVTYVRELDDSVVGFLYPTLK